MTPGALTRSNLAKILSQLKDTTQPLSIEILPMAKANQPQTDSLPKFLAQYISQSHIGSLTKEDLKGKMVNDWNNALGGEDTKPQVTDIAPAVAAILAVKDEEELARLHASRHSIN